MQFWKKLSQIGHDQFINHDLPALIEYKENLHLKQSNCAEEIFSLLKRQQEKPLKAQVYPRNLQPS